MLMRLPSFEGKKANLYFYYFRYTVKASDGGIKLKVEADLVWKQSILEQIKPFIVADVHRGMESFGKSLESGLTIC